MTSPQPPAITMSPTTEPHATLHALRQQRRARRAHGPLPPTTDSLGARMADKLTSLVGSWPFIITQSVIIVIWLALNLMGWQQRWDPYPFILLNLMLSFQAAFTAPIIMMSQNRQAILDRQQATEDFEINRKAELEIEALHEKVDALREAEIARLIKLVENLSAELAAARSNWPAPTTKP